MISLDDDPVTEIDTFVRASPLEGTVSVHGPKLVGAPVDAVPDLKFGTVRIDTIRHIQALVFTGKHRMN